MTTSIYVEDSAGAQYYFASGLTGTEDIYIDPGETGTWKAVAERYGFKRQEITFEPATGGNVQFNTVWVEDVSLSGTPVATVAAYTDLGTAQKVNDYEAYWRTTEAGIKYADTLSRNGETIDWTPYDVEIDPLAATPYSITGNKVTVKTTNLVANTVTTTGTVTYANGGTITGVVTDVNGVTSQTSITGLVDCSVAIFDDNDDIFDFEANVTGTYTVTIPAGTTGVWRYVVTKQAHVAQAGSFSLGTGVTNTVNWTAILDQRIVDATEAIVTAYAQLDTTQKMYDYWSYWVTSEEGIEWYDVVKWNGMVLDTTNADLDVDATAPDLAVLDPVTNKVTIRSTTLAGDIQTNGTVVRLNGATTTGVVSDDTGVTTIITFSGFTSTNKLYVEDETDTQRLFTDVTTGEHVLYLLPAEQTAGDWTWAAKKTGFQHVSGTFNVSTGGRIIVQVGMTRINQPNGQAMYGNTVAPAGLSIDWTTSVDGTPRIKLGDQAYSITNVYDEADRSMSSLDGMRWIAAGRNDVRIATLPSGNFLFLTTGWRIMQAVAGSDNAALNAFAISEDNQNIDNVNGPVSLISSTAALADDDLNKLRETWDRLVNFVEPKVDLTLIDTAAIIVDLEDIKGTGFVKDKQSLTNIKRSVNTSIGVSA